MDPEHWSVRYYGHGVRLSSTYYDYFPSEAAQLSFKFSKYVANFVFNREQLNYISSAV
jgi:hypothetical protein